MAITARRTRIIAIVGLTTILLGTLDPLEGSLIILAGIVVVTVAGMMGGSEHQRLLYTAFALAAVGIAAMWGLSAVGGFGGRTSGRSWWWGLLLVPYPVGWAIALLGTVRLLRDTKRASAAVPQ